MPITLNESAIVALRKRFLANLSAEIDNINATQLDPTVPLDHAAQILDFAPSIAHLIDFPTVAIHDGRSHFQDDIGFEATGAHQLIIVAFIQDPDLHSLAWKLRRYTQAIVRVALLGRNLEEQGGDDQIWGTRLSAVVPGPTLSRADPNAVQGFMSWNSVIIDCLNDQIA